MNFNPTSQIFLVAVWYSTYIFCWLWILTLLSTIFLSCHGGVRMAMPFYSTASLQCLPQAQWHETTISHIILAKVTPVKALLRLRYDLAGDKKPYQWISKVLINCEYASWYGPLQFTWQWAFSHIVFPTHKHMNHNIRKFVCLCWGFTAQSTQWGHVERG